VPWGCATNARAGSVEQKTANRKMSKMSDGKICRSRRSPLPMPHTPRAKLCAFCAGKRFVQMTFRGCSRWQYRFWTEANERLLTELTFQNADKIRKIARRGNGLIDNRDRDGFELDLEVGRGGTWLRLTDEQYSAPAGTL